MKLLIASHNPGKIAEFKKLFNPYGYQVVSLLDFPDIEEVEETGNSFEENARLKAESIAKQLQMLTLADDSGLCVPALNNEPGIYSARYAGEPKNDEKNRLKLLERMKHLKGEERAAYFITCIVLASPSKDSLVVEGKVWGSITEEAKGEGGFGYDALFYYPGAQMTFAQMQSDQKNKISHRGLAVLSLKEKLADWMEP